jgi:hypothetical protein
VLVPAHLARANSDCEKKINEFIGLLADIAPTVASHAMDVADEMNFNQPFAHGCYKFKSDICISHKQLVLVTALVSTRATFF